MTYKRVKRQIEKLSLGPRRWERLKRRSFGRRGIALGPTRGSLKQQIQQASTFVSPSEDLGPGWRQRAGPWPVLAAPCLLKRAQKPRNTASGLTTFEITNPSFYSNCKSDQNQQSSRPNATHARRKPDQFSIRAEKTNDMERNLSHNQPNVPHMSQ
eukprot:874976-Amorphochlora_amoeboformis.AAC.1